MNCPARHKRSGSSPAGHDRLATATRREAAPRSKKRQQEKGSGVFFRYPGPAACAAGHADAASTPTPADAPCAFARRHHQRACHDGTRKGVRTLYRGGDEAVISEQRVLTPFFSLLL